MTRTYALKRLLEHGKMTRGQILEVMGGNKKTASNALCALMDQGIVEKLVSVTQHGKEPVYVLTQGLD